MIVLLSGKAGSGKSTLKDALIAAFGRLGIKATGLRFAGPLYEAHHAVQKTLAPYGLPVLEKDRVLLQVLGTEWGRASRGENVWVEMLAGAAKNAFAQGTRVVVVDDCRFPNEKNFDFGVPAITVRLSCGTYERQVRLGGSLPPEHSSETALDDASFMFTFMTDKMPAADIAALLANELSKGVTLCQ